MSESFVDAKTVVTGEKVDEQLVDVVDYGSGEIGLLKDEWSGLGGGDFNPDDIKLETYIKMLNQDAQVGAAATLFKLALLSKPWDISFPEGEEPENAEEIIEFLKWNFQNVNRTVHYRGGLRAALEDMLEGPMLGFTVAEPVYEQDTYKGETKIILLKLKNLPQETITFWSDKYGNLEKVQQESVGSPINLVPLGKFIIWSFNVRKGNWYGNPLLKRAYKHWYIKEFLLKKWNIFLERKAVPMLLGKTRPANIKNLRKLLSSTNEKSIAVVETNDAVDVVQSKAVSSQFKMAIQYHDMMIFRGMLTPTLLLGQEDVGARALGDTHFQVFMWVVNKMKEDVVNIASQMLTTLTKLNYPNVEIMPAFVIPELSTEDRDKFSVVVKEMVTVGVLDPTEDWIRKKLGFPLNSDWEGPNALLPPQPPEEPDDADKSGSSTKINGFDIPNSESREINQPALLVKISPERMCSMMETSEHEGIAKLRRYVEGFGQSIEEQTSKLLDGYDPESPDRFDYLSELKKLKSTKDKVMVNILLSLEEEYLKRLTDYYIQRMEVAEAKSSAQKQEFDIPNSDTMKVLQERAFTSAGVFNSALLEMGKNALITGIQSGLTVEDMMAELDDIYPGFSENRLRTVVRTNITAAASMGALEVMRDTAGFVNGVRYTAIIDDRTTLFCDQHDGETLPVNDPRVDPLTPPNHYSCRSYWVPVTILDTGVNTNTWSNFGTQPDQGFGINPELVPA